MNIDGEITRNVVVFDCNIYLDAARLFDEPFAWSKVQAVLADLAHGKSPHPRDRALDSLQAMNYARFGEFGAGVLEVWTSRHIDETVRNMAERAAIPERPGDYSGLGWSRQAAQGIVDDLIHELVIESGGGIVEGYRPDGNPPLDHEDGMVYGACRVLAGDDPLAKVYCVTRDRGFLAAYENGGLGGHSRVMPPGKFVDLGRKEYRMNALDRIPKPRG
ncbi:hypothetical protein GCM10010435_39090 [Winogradskya consettensis]|uniref:Uncharacterized protein n=1 Tax=Winogradskya consettensis TaxID=113560 RepID=A0A919T4J9_9ACTN|nr:hypothetical protein [Actinoplanes consettensis]GIM84706.1 hypothetical protein Aco04nite_92680 [Actinoplanes consettensis]